MNRMNKPLTLKMLAAIAAGLAVLYVVFFAAMNWKLTSGVLQGTHTVSQALRQAEPSVGGFIFLVVIACLVIQMLLGAGSGAVSNDDDFPHRRDYDQGPQVNPANGLPMVPGGQIDVMGNPYGFDNDRH